ncbi:hypothetical protein DFJ73DRAFT_759216 [Zopfochytrium polystomum]|nr:hypothetical protein DFJ73DRAFT_759216 [Zopfochytrium polystomum]
MIATLLVVCAASSVSAVGFSYGNIELNNVEAFVYTAVKTLFDNRDVSLVDKYWSPGYIQHNPSIPNGIDGLKSFISTSNISYDIGFVASNKNIVSLHVLATDRPTGNQSVIVDWFRVENGQIAEHWDTIQTAVPASKTASGNPMADPETERNSYNTSLCGDLAVESAERARAVEALTQLLTNSSAKASDYLQDPYIQHNPNAGNGVAAFESFRAFLGQATEYGTGLTTVKCDIVFMHTRGAFSGTGGAASVTTDIYRAKGDKFVEHWDVVQDETPVANSVSGNPMFSTDEVGLIHDVDQSQYGPVGKFATTSSSSSSSILPSGGTIYYSAATSRRGMMPFGFVRFLWK